MIVPEPFEPTIEMPQRTEPWPTPGIPRASRRPVRTAPPQSARGEIVTLAICAGVALVFGMLFAAGLVAVAERMAAGAP